jgi:hypothetical protein
MDFIKNFKKTIVSILVAIAACIAFLICSLTGNTADVPEVIVNDSDSIVDMDSIVVDVDTVIDVLDVDKIVNDSDVTISNSDSDITKK